jgi:hypothetical protein
MASGVSAAEASDADSTIHANQHRVAAVVLSLQVAGSAV